MNATCRSIGCSERRAAATISDADDSAYRLEMTPLQSSSTENFYLANAVCRASTTMAKCAGVFSPKKGEL